MPDIDTLFIIGLVIASIIGNLSKKKGKQTVKKDRVPDKKIEPNQNPTLEDVFKEVWDNFKKPPESTNNAPVEQERSLPVSLPQEMVQEEEKKTAEVKRIPQHLLDAEFSSKHSLKEMEEKSKFPTIKRDLFSSKASLKKAFVFKEILDQPVSMRKSSF